MVSSGAYTYTYDGYNRRVISNDSKGTSYSFYDAKGQLLLRETQEGLTSYVFMGKKMVAKHKDYTEAPKPAGDSKMHYKPFGDSIEAPKDDVGYTGHKFDTDLGLSYMQQRYYDPVIGRFYGNDPVGFDSVHNFNRYTYANNNPYKFVDPDGRDVVSANPANNKALLGHINSLTTTTYTFNSKNKLEKAGLSSQVSKAGGSKYYASKIDTAIASSKTMSLDISPTYVSTNGNTYDVDKSAGGGVAVPQPNGDVDITISGNSNGASGPNEILSHEIVGHGVPLMGESDTGNAIENTNKVRDENGIQNRAPDPNHKEK